MKDQVLFIVGNLIQGKEPSALSEGIIKSTVLVAIKVLQEIDRQVVKSA